MFCRFFLPSFIRCDAMRFDLFVVQGGFLDGGRFFFFFFRLIWCRGSQLRVNTSPGTGVTFDG